MANKRYDACSPRPKKDGGTYWHKCGTAFDGDKGMTILFDSLPLADNEGRVVVKLFEAKPRENQGGQRQANNNFATDDDDINW